MDYWDSFWKTFWHILSKFSPTSKQINGGAEIKSPANTRKIKMRNKYEWTTFVFYTVLVIFCLLEHNIQYIYTFVFFLILNTLCWKLLTDSEEVISLEVLRDCITETIKILWSQQQPGQWHVKMVEVKNFLSPHTALPLPPLPTHLTQKTVCLQPGNWCNSFRYFQSIQTSEIYKRK